MHRSTIVAGAVLAVLALAGCGRQQAAAGPPNGGGGLAAYVMTDTAGAGAAGAPATPRPGECSKGRRAYQALVFLVSSDTGTSVQRITEDLRAGRSLDDVAGAKSPEVRAQAVGLVQARLRFAQANGRLTEERAGQYRPGAAAVIDALMAANVSACVPAGG